MKHYQTVPAIRCHFYFSNFCDLHYCPNLLGLRTGTCWKLTSITTLEYFTDMVEFFLSRDFGCLGFWTKIDLGS